MLGFPEDPSMPKPPDVGWDEPSDPQISVTALLPAHAEDVRSGNIAGERCGQARLVGQIAVGGMAELFLAVQQGMEGFIKVVVLKRVLPHFNDHAEFVRMFID